jgi:NADH-quinone oxidoreductase subunit N
MPFTSTDFLSILPIVVIVVWASALLLVEAFIDAAKKAVPLLAAIGLAVSLGFAFAGATQKYVGFKGMVVADGFAGFLQVLFLLSGLLAIALAYNYNKRIGLDRSEFFVLLLFSISGMMLMAVAVDLIVVFLALELLSIPLYVLAGLLAPNTNSEEAALKYFLLGAFAGGFVVYGIALAFGATGTTNLNGIFEAIDSGVADMGLLAIGAALILVGFGFKVAVVPFQMWTPDVYEGAPTSVTAFMAVGAKAAGFAALLRIFLAAMPGLADQLVPVLWTLAALTMFVGNLLAIAQRNIKRMLAYSSIAHAGYIFMALTAMGQAEQFENAVSSALFYLLAYALTSFGAWSVVMALEKAEGKGLEIEDYAGLGRKYPALSVAMLIFMLSLTGVPPTLGFFGKFYLFGTVIAANFIGLALIGVLTSLISAYYYLRVVIVMYMRPGEPEVERDPWLQLTTGVAAVGTVVLGLFAQPILNWASQAVLYLF